MLVGCGDQHADGKGGSSVLAPGDGHFVEVSGFGRPRGCSLGGHVTAGVFGEVVTAHEASVAHGADKLFLARVSSAMAGKLVRTGKLFIAAIPMTTERLLTCRGRGRMLAGS